MSDDHPDLSSLPARMRFAASVLEEAMEHDFCKTPVWHPDSLRRVADRLDEAITHDGP